MKFLATSVSVLLGSSILLTGCGASDDQTASTATVAPVATAQTAVQTPSTAATTDGGVTSTTDTDTAGSTTSTTNPSGNSTTQGTSKQLLKSHNKIWKALMRGDGFGACKYMTANYKKLFAADAGGSGDCAAAATGFGETMREVVGSGTRTVSKVQITGDKAIAIATTPVQNGSATRSQFGFVFQNGTWLLDSEKDLD